MTRGGQRAIEKLSDWICEIGADSVTIDPPYLLTLIKTRYPPLKVRASLFAGSFFKRLSHDLRRSITTL